MESEKRHRDKDTHIRKGVIDNGEAREGGAKEGTEGAPLLTRTSTLRKETGKKKRLVRMQPHKKQCMKSRKDTNKSESMKSVRNVSGSVSGETCSYGKGDERAAASA